jgi:DNA-binding XRE family transcriptional regulator
MEKRSLKSARAERNLTQKQVADGVGIARNTYMNYELGKTKPSVQIASEIASFLGFSIDQIRFKQ